MVLINWEVVRGKKAWGTGPFFRIQVEKFEFCNPVQVAVLENVIHVAFEDLFPQHCKTSWGFQDTVNMKCRKIESAS